MNIIFISNKSARAKNIVLTNTHLILAASSLVIITIILAMGLNYLTLHYSDKISDRISSLFLVVPQQEVIDAHANLHGNLDVMAVKLGKMQAQLMRLDALGERLAKSRVLKLKNSCLIKHQDKAVPCRHYLLRHFLLMSLSKG